MKLADAHPVARRLRGPLTPTVLAPLAIQTTLILSGTVAARVLGVRDRGYLALLVLVPTVLYQFGGLGFPVAVAYFVARDNRAARGIARLALRPAIVQTVATTLVHVVVIVLVVAGDPHQVRIAAFATLGFVPAAFAQQYGLVILQGQRRFVSFNALRVLPPLLYAVLLAGAVVMGARSLVVVAGLYVGALAVAAAVTLRVAVRGLATDASKESLPTRRAMFRFGASGLLGSSSPLEVFRLDQTLVALLLTPAGLGLYTVAMAFTNLPVFFSQSIGMLAYPEVAARDASDARRMLWRLFFFNLVVCGLFVGVLEAAVAWLLPLFFGRAFAPAIAAARLLLVATLFLSCRRVLSDAVRGAGRPLFGTIAEVAAWAVFVPAAVLVGRDRGPAGIAAAFVLGTAVSLAVLLVLVLTDRREEREAASRHRRRISVAFFKRVLVVLSVAVLLAAVGLAVPALASNALLGLIALLALFSWAAFLVVRSEVRLTGDHLTPLTLITVYYALGFGVGSIYYSRHQTGFFVGRYTQRDLLVALFVGVLSWALLVAGYRAALLRTISRSLPAVNLDPAGAVWAFVIPIEAVGWLARLMLLAQHRYFHTAPAGSAGAGSSGSTWIVAAASLLPLVAAAYVGMATRTSPFRNPLFLAMIAVETAWYVPTGDRGSLISLGLVLVATQYFRAGRLPSRIMIAGALIGTFIVLPFGLAYRGDNVAYQQSPRGQLSKAVAALTSGGIVGALTSGLDATGSRFSDVASVAVVMNRGRAPLDRLFGETLTWAAGAFVPRALIPNKVDPGRFGNEFGRKYGIIAPNNYVTSVAISEPGELYMSVGWLGLAIGMFVIGSIYRLLDDLLRNRWRTAGTAAVYSVILWPLIQSQGTIFAQGLMGCLKLLVVLFGICGLVAAFGTLGKPARKGLLGGAHELA